MRPRKGQARTKYNSVRVINVNISSGPELTSPKGEGTSDAAERNFTKQGFSQLLRQSSPECLTFELVASATELSLRFADPEREEKGFVAVRELTGGVFECSVPVWLSGCTTILSADRIFNISHFVMPQRDFAVLQYLNN